MNQYPHVLGEGETLEQVLAGRSLARYGDGEFNICRGGHSKRQKFNLRLSERLNEILRSSGECLVGIPNIWSDTPKRTFWRKYVQARHLLAERDYVSAFVTRPDSAPWIDTPAYWARVDALWRDQDVTLVRGSDKSLTAADLVSAKAVREILAPPFEAWADYPALLRQIGTPARAILCLGPAATVLAVDLCARGVHAIDAGHIGRFLRKHRRGEPMICTAEDHAA